MNAKDVIAGLSLPISARVDQRVPKKLFLENGTPTAADKRLLADSIQEIQWIAALKPNTIGVPEYRDTQREYLEIALLEVTLRGQVKPGGKSRLAELLHRAVPYPLFLVMIDGESLELSVAHKRWAQNEAEKVVLDGDVVTASLIEKMAMAPNAQVPVDPMAIESAFISSMAVSRQPQSNLYDLYQGWVDRLNTLKAALLTGRYCVPLSPEQAAARRQALDDCERLEAEISRLRHQASKEKQLARQVELNLTMKDVQAKLKVARQLL